MEASDIAKITFELIRINNDRLIMKWEDDRGKLLKEIIRYNHERDTSIARLEKKYKRVRDDLQSQVALLRQELYRSLPKLVNKPDTSSSFIPKQTEIVAVDLDNSPKKLPQQLKSKVSESLKPMQLQPFKRKLLNISNIPHENISLLKQKEKENKKNTDNDRDMEKENRIGDECVPQQPISELYINVPDITPQMSPIVLGNPHKHSHRPRSSPSPPSSPVLLPPRGAPALKSLPSETRISTDRQMRLPTSLKRSSTSLTSPSHTAVSHSLSSKTGLQSDRPETKIRRMSTHMGTESRRPGKSIEVVRNKRQREVLPGHVCAECRELYSELARQGLLSEDSMAELLANCSRHKSATTLPKTPEGFWDLSIHTPADWK